MISDLDELVEVLRQIQILVLQGREMFDEDPRQRWSIERLWIHAGNLASDLAPGVIPDSLASDLVGLRVVYAHIWPSNLDANRVWEDSQEVHDLLVQLAPR